MGTGRQFEVEAWARPVPKERRSLAVDDIFTQTRRAHLVPATIRLPLTEQPGETWAEYFRAGLEGVALEEGESIRLVNDNVEIVSPKGRFQELAAAVAEVISRINTGIAAANAEKLRIIQETYSAY